MTEGGLIHKVRAEVEGVLCMCQQPSWVKRNRMCHRCHILKMIDDGLAEIGQTKKEMMADEREAAAISAYLRS